MSWSVAPSMWFRTKYGTASFTACSQHGTPPLIHAQCDASNHRCTSFTLHSAQSEPHQRLPPSLLARTVPQRAGAAAEHAVALGRSSDCCVHLCTDRSATHPVSTLRVRATEDKSIPPPPSPRLPQKSAPSPPPSSQARLTLTASLSRSHLNGATTWIIGDHAATRCSRSRDTGAQLRCTLARKQPR